MCTIEYHPNNYIIEDLGHSWGTSLRNCLGAVFFNKGLIRHLFSWGNLAFEAFKALWRSKVNGPALLKEGGERVVMFFTPKVCVHNRVPSKQLHY